LKLIQLAVTGGVVLVLGLFVIRPIVVGALARAEAPPILPEASQIAAGDVGLSGEVAPPGVALSGQVSQTSGVTRLPPSDEDMDPVQRLKQLIDERQDDTVEILRGDWLMGQAVTLEDFALVAAGQPHAAANWDPVTFRKDAFDEGYTAGWEDALKQAQSDAAKAETQISDALQALDFTYFEARHHVLAQKTH